MLCTIPFRVLLSRFIKLKMMRWLPFILLSLLIKRLRLMNGLFTRSAQLILRLVKSLPVLMLSSPLILVGLRSYQLAKPTTAQIIQIVLDVLTAIGMALLTIFK